MGVIQEIPVMHMKLNILIFYFSNVFVHSNLVLMVSLLQGVFTISSS